ncbi:hypothetical protein OROGR_007569 [Orobanche gracilis]
MFGSFQDGHHYHTLFPDPVHIEQPVQHQSPVEVSDRFSCERDADGDDVCESAGPQLGEGSLPPRVSRPSAVLREPFVVAPPRDSEALKRLYLQFRQQPRDAVVTCLETGHLLGQPLFDRIESLQEDFDAETIDCYVLATRARLRRGVRSVGAGRVSTVLAGSQFYLVLASEFAKLHPGDPLGTKVTGKPV